MPMLLLGSQENKIDQKNRIFLPSKFREPYGSDFVMSFDEDRKCIKCLTTENFINIYNSYNNGDDEIYLEKGAKLQRLIRNSTTATIDNQGRTTIPSKWLESMSVNGTALIVGMVNYFEIWGSDDYAEDDNNLKQAIKLADRTERSTKKANALKDLAVAEAVIEENKKLIED